MQKLSAGEIKKREMIRGQRKEGGGRAQRDGGMEDERHWGWSGTMGGVGRIKHEGTKGEETQVDRGWKKE